MEIAHSGGEGRHPHPGLGALNGPGIVAPGDILLGLPGDVPLLRQAAQGFKQLPVVDGPPVHVGDHRPLSGGAHPARPFDLGQVGGGGGLPHQGDLRGDRKGGPKGPPGAHLLLGGKGEGHVQRQVLLQQLQQNGAANPVVDGLGFEEAVPQLLRLPHKGAVGAQGDFR